MKHKFNYNWTLKDAVFTKDKGKVFSCFACGGGSTMGYKLAGFDVIGHNDIDPKMIEVYKANHNPKFSFLESITTFAKRKDLANDFLYMEDMFTQIPKIKMDFNEKEIVFSEIYEINNNERLLTGKALELWNERIDSDLDLDNVSTRKGRPNFMFNYKFIKKEKVCNTITAGDCCCLYDEPRYRSKKELCYSGTYPKDYNFIKLKPEYLIGMSVPPIMTAQIASNIHEQWLSKL